MCIHITTQITSLEIEEDGLPTKVIIDTKHHFLDQNRKNNQGHIFQFLQNEGILKLIQMDIIAVRTLAAYRTKSGETNATVIQQLMYKKGLKLKEMK
jgi:hypothetical protein